MLHHPTHDRLAELGLHGAATAFADLIADPQAAELDHAALLGREATLRMDRRLQTRLRFARLRHPQACPEDLDYRTPRGLDRTLIATLSAPDWITSARSVIITGPPASAKVGLPVPSHTAPAATTSPSSITVPPGSKSWPWPTATAAMPGCSR